MSKPDYAEPLTDAQETETLDTASLSRRIWQHSPSQGSLQLSLKAMGVLYDAKRPLTREELIDGFTALLDPYDRAYLEAWYQRRQQVQKRLDVKRRPSAIENNRLPSMAWDLTRIVRTWFTAVFFKRISNGESLVRTSDGRFAPGPRAPRMLTVDGKLIRFTPEARTQLAETEHTESRSHAAWIEWDHLLKAFPTPDLRAHLLIYLIRRLILNTTKAKTKQPVDERVLRPLTDHLIRLADRPAIQQRVLQRALDALWLDTKSDA